MKRILSMLVVLALCGMFVACEKKAVEPTTEGTTGTVEQPAPTPAPAAQPTETPAPEGEQK
jgi:hypothetical protein